MITRELFARHVRDALGHFYDIPHLRTHPLTNLLVPKGIPQETRRQSLRQILVEAVESLRPPESVPYDQPEWLSYRVLSLRYLESLSPSEVCKELNLGRTSLFKYQKKGLSAVVSILWEKRLLGDISYNDIKGMASEAVPTHLAEAEAVRLAHRSRRQAVSLDALLDSLKRMVLPLAAEQGVDLAIRAPDSLPMTYGDPAMLRQAILSTLTEAFQYSNALELEVSVDAGETIWRLRGLGPVTSIEELDNASGIAVSRGVLDVYGGTMRVEKDETGGTILALTILTIKRKILLIIDDDPSALDLYQRYLETQEYDLRVARSAQEAWQVLGQVTPDLVMLDVLMPQEDGWDILQRLKTMPETEAIPVLICSVLSQPHLALTLGAAGVLQKPISQDILLRALGELLPQR